MFTRDYITVSLINIIIITGTRNTASRAAARGAAACSFDPARSTNTTTTASVRALHPPLSAGVRVMAFGAAPT